MNISFSVLMHAVSALIAHFEKAKPRGEFLIVLNPHTNIIGVGINPKEVAGGEDTSDRDSK